MLSNWLDFNLILLEFWVGLGDTLNPYTFLQYQQLQF